MDDDEICAQATVNKCICLHLSITLSSPFLFQGVFWGLMIGLLVGCIRMIMDFVYPAPPCYEADERPSVLKHVHFLYFSILLTCITLIVVVVISLATEEPKPEQVRPLNQM